MTLPAGARLGPYEILSRIGAGGMGEVYKARDTRLARVVALKLLPPELAARPDRRARFETEARAISALSHPHICTLFDVGEQDGRPFLVMEHLDGETLDDRLAAGALPPNAVIGYASEIADALDHAHREGIVHRDLKPSNVMLTASGSKLLDFGLARGPVIEAAAAGSTMSFEHRRLTAEGTMIGTFQYMAPEQLEGKTADARTDIFAFGTLIYEMATGRKAFDGKSQASLIASILTEQPPPVSSSRTSAIPDAALFALDHVVERCLAKNPDERWQSARDVKLELDWITRGPSPARTGVPARRGPRRREAIAWTLAIVASAVAAGVLQRTFHTGPHDITRFVVAPPPGATIGVPENKTRVAVSPDGRRLAFVATTGGGNQIWVRSLDSVTSSPVANTDGGVSPFWSPDSRFIGFLSPGDGEIKKVDVSGGPARTICAADSDGTPTWGRDGTILFTQFRQGIFRVSAEGGTPTPVTRVDKSRGEMNHYWPSFLPDGRHFLYMATARDARGLRATPTNYIASLDSEEVKPLARMHSAMVYAQPGYLMFVQDGALLAQQFDAGSLRLRGEPAKIADGLAYFRTLGNAGFTVSPSGALAYHGSGDDLRFGWYDRRGNAVETGWPTENVSTVRISPDAQRAAVDVIDPRTGTADIWFHDLSGGAPVRLTSDLASEQSATWSPDGRRIVFSSERLGAPSLLMKTIETGAEEQLVGGPVPLAPDDWSADGRWIAYVSNSSQTGRDLWLLPIAGDRKPRQFSGTRFDEWGARFSPDSAWMAFASDESGKTEVYVASVQRPGEKRAVSIGGGAAPRWKRDGRELYYLSADNRSIMAVPIEPGATFKAGPPARLFSLGTPTVSRGRARATPYDVSPDGQRFLIGVPAGDPSSSLITVVLNWASALKR